jgi:predicted GNAT superfamily acetyltransferase
MSDRNAVPSNIIHAMIIAGGAAIGAYDREQLIGMSMSLPYFKGCVVALWSHMTGVHPAYQSHHIGYELKQMQRTWALENGYKQIRWTFDPLQRGNANFNMAMLGTTANIYHINLYGNQLGNLNAGLPTDRVEVMWQLDDPRVVRLSTDREQVSVTVSFPDENFVLAINGEEVTTTSPETIDPFQWYFIQIPPDVNELKQSNLQFVRQWQSEIRNMLQHMFKRGCALVDFIVEPERCFYVLGIVDKEY